MSQDTPSPHPALAGGFAVIVAMLLAWSAWAAPLKQAVLIPQWEPQAQFAGYYVALAKGFYTAAGVDLRILRGGPQSPPSALLRDGRAQFGTFFLATALRDRAAGVPLVNLIQFTPTTTQLLIARKASGIEKPADLDGKRVSLWGPEFRLQPEAFFRRHGIRVTEVPQGFTVDLFLRGAVDACSAMRYNEYHALLAAGLDPQDLTVFDLGAEDLNLPEDGLYTLDATWKSDPQLCRAVAQASLAGWRYAFEHPDEALDIVMSHVAAAHLPTNRLHQQWMLGHLRQAMTAGGASPGPLTPQQHARTGEALLRAGLITDVPDYEAFHADIR